MLRPFPRAPLELCERWLTAAIGLRNSEFARCCSGVAALEFAIMLPVLMLFLFGTIAVSSVFYIQSNMETAAREGARRMAVAEATFTGGDVLCSSAAAQIVGSAENYSCRFMPGWGLDFTVNASEVCPAGDVIVRVTADASTAALTDIHGFFSGRILSAVVIMRKEAACP